MPRADTKCSNFSTMAAQAVNNRLKKHSDIMDELRAQVEQLGREQKAAFLEWEANCKEREAQNETMRNDIEALSKASYANLKESERLLKKSMIQSQEMAQMRDDLDRLGKATQRSELLRLQFLQKKRKSNSESVEGK